MKIIRNGIWYELTREEMREAYEKIKEEYLREDIESSAEAMEIKLSGNTMDYVVRRVDKSLSNNDSYWDSYWMTIENILEEQLEG
jgi:hypothetical protein